MPSEKEIQEIAAYRAVPESELWKQTDNDTDPRYFHREDIGRKYPIYKSTGGKISPAPNCTWAFEREIDARVEELQSNKDILTDVEKAKLSGEMRGLAMGLSMWTGRTVEQCSISALERYMERHAPAA